ncbi:hypothetical protein Bca4012_050836 [Brassica carinata]|uniref:Uncharacterized protein n=1 Tax=Brassica carinata TaxID=52824 RepID=A0A8X7R4D8_BRACI|nr:hypothetical protein Bca52824_053539 [Brassica carinata]
MEALKVDSFTSMSVLSEKRSEPRRPFSLPSIFPPKKTPTQSPWKASSRASMAGWLY